MLNVRWRPSNNIYQKALGNAEKEEENKKRPEKHKL